MKRVNLKVKISSLKLKNPIMPASGTFGYGIEFRDFFDVNKLGAIVTKGLSINEVYGNKPQRTCEVSSGMLNAIGLQNIGLLKFKKEFLPKLNKIDSPIIVNFFGRTINEYVEFAKRAEDEKKIKALEMNISCPNIKRGGISFGTDPKEVFKITKSVRKATKKPLFVKLSPNVTDIKIIAKSAEQAGADGLTCINTLLGMAIDIEKRKPKLANIVGGLSGPCIKPVALRMVYEVAKTVKIPVIGVGGITCALDVLEFMIAGAKAVQIGTANFRDPRVMVKIIEELEDILREKNIYNIEKVVGSMKI